MHNARNWLWTAGANGRSFRREVIALKGVKMAQPSIFARIKKPVHLRFLQVCKEERRSMTAQVEIALEEWMNERDRQRIKRAAAG